MTNLPARRDEALLRRTIAILQQFEPPEGYWLAFSGGKDSVVLLALAKQAGVKFDAHYNLTTVDPPELVQFIRREFPEVDWVRPKQTFRRFIESQGLPFRTRPNCCREFKESGGRDRIVLVGNRAEESARRAKQSLVHHCKRIAGKRTLSPLRDWKESDVWSCIREHELPWCSLYADGWRRLGCVLCPNETRIAKAMSRWPRIFEMARKASIIFWETHPNREMRKRWRSAEEYWQWWLSRTQPYPPRLEEQDAVQLNLYGGGMC